MDNPRVLVLGASGLLGNTVYQHLVSTEEFEVFGTGRSDPNFIYMHSSKTELTNVIDRVNPDYIINCIASLQKSKNLKMIWEILKVNSLFPWTITCVARKRSIFLIHFSTNAVFNGHKGSYRESSWRIPSSLYGLSKLLGEPQAKNVFVLRTSFIGVGRRDSSLVSRIQSAPEYSSMIGFDNHYWNGVSSGILAKLCAGLVRNSFKKAGVSHFHASDTVSKYDLMIKLAVRFSRKDLLVSCLSSKHSSDLTLKSNSSGFHDELWNLAGFSRPISVDDIVKHQL